MNLSTLNSSKSSNNSNYFKIIIMKITFFIIMSINFQYGQESILLKLSVPFLLLIMHIVFGEGQLKSWIYIILMTIIFTFLSYQYSIPFPQTTSLISTSSLFLIHGPNNLQSFHLYIYLIDFIISWYMSAQDSYRLKIIVSSITLLFFLKQKKKQFENNVQRFLVSFLKDFFPYLIIIVIFYHYDKILYLAVLVFALNNSIKKQ